MTTAEIRIFGNRLVPIGNNPRFDFWRGKPNIVFDGGCLIHFPYRPVEKFMPYVPIMAVKIIYDKYQITALLCLQRFKEELFNLLCQAPSCPAIAWHI
ncbi:MAG: hypothetical protein OXC27_22740 [Caldilineaceae bacterium]|nr:hypothetical protein [Caldilineaceae bacterium]